MSTKSTPKPKVTNVAVEKTLLEGEEPEEEAYSPYYIKNYYGPVTYHVYAGSQFIEQAGNPPPPPPYGGG